MTAELTRCSAKLIGLKLARPEVVHEPQAREDEGSGTHELIAPRWRRVVPVHRAAGMVSFLGAEQPHPSPPKRP